MEAGCKSWLMTCPMESLNTYIIGNTQGPAGFNFLFLRIWVKVAITVLGTTPKPPAHGGLPVISVR